MKWTRYKLLIISGGITLVLSVGLIFWIMSTLGKRNQVQGQIESLEEQQTRLSSEKPFPSARNYDQLKSEQGKVIVQRDQLKELIREKQLQPVVLNRSRFGEYIKSEYVPEIRAAARAATKGSEYGVILADPDFGLSEYLQGVLPETVRIPSLLLELETMAHLSKLLFDSGISELNLVKAVEEESSQNRRAERATPVAPTVPGFNMGMVDPATGVPLVGQQNDEGLSDLQKEKNRLFTYKDYRLEFKAYEDFLWETLNRFAADPNQLVITELYITTADKELWPDYLKPALGTERGGSSRSQRNTPRPREPANELERLLLGAGDAGISTVAPENEVKIAGLPSRRQNVIGGNLLNVVIVVRVYRLNQETSATVQGL